MNEFEHMKTASATDKIGMTYLKNEIQADNIQVGIFTYYAKIRPEENFERDNILYNYPGHGNLIIGNYCSIANGVEIIMPAANHSIASFSTYPFFEISPDWREKVAMTHEDMPDKGDTIIGHDVWIGQKATIMPGVHIGNGAVIGSKALVTKDVPPYAIVGGNPAKVLKYRFDQETIDFLQELKWWDFSEEQMNQAIPHLTSLHLVASKEALLSIAKSV